MILAAKQHETIQMKHRQSAQEPLADTTKSSSRQRKSPTSKKSKKSASASTPTTCGAYDVLCGKNSYSNPGNEFFRKLIQKYRDPYRSTAVRDQKRRIIEQVLEAVHARGGRFLKSTAAADEVIPHAAQYEKVSHALRSARAPVSTAVQTRADLAGNVSSLLEKQRHLFQLYCRQQAAQDATTAENSVGTADTEESDEESAGCRTMQDGCNIVPPPPQPIGSSHKSLDADTLYALLHT